MLLHDGQSLLEWINYILLLPDLCRIGANLRQVVSVVTFARLALDDAISDATVVADPVLEAVSVDVGYEGIANLVK